jgi:hypothetical protein
MENVIVNHRRVVTGNKRNQADTLTPKGAEAALEPFCFSNANGHNSSRLNDGS